LPLPRQRTSSSRRPRRTGPGSGPVVKRIRRDVEHTHQCRAARVPDRLEEGFRAPHRLRVASHSQTRKLLGSPMNWPISSSPRTRGDRTVGQVCRRPVNLLGRCRVFTGPRVRL
jgi:hypothetical protein